MRHPDDDEEECPFVVRPDTRDEKQDVPTRDLVNERLMVQEKNRGLAGFRLIRLLEIVFVVGMLCLSAAGRWAPDTRDSIERVLLPTITGLIGILGGLYMSTNSRS